MASAKELKRALVGRRIVKVLLNPFDDGTGRRKMAHRPEVHLDDGSVLVFTASETEMGEYGVDLIVVKSGT